MVRSYIVCVSVENGLTPIQLIMALENEQPDFTETEQQRRI